MKTGKKKIQSFLLLLLLLYLGFVALLFFLQRNFLYFPNTEKPDITQAPWAEPIRVQTIDGLTLHAWWKAPKSSNEPLVILFHGNAGHIEHRIDKAQKYISQGYGLILAEYRGYGGNPAQPSEYGLYNDARAYIDWAVREAQIPLARIVLHGASLGSGVATQMATEYNLKALILEAPFYSVLSMAQHRYPFIPFMKILVQDPYRNDLKINTLHMPVLIGLGEKDNIVPAKFGQRLFEKASEPKEIRIYPQASHTDLDEYGFAEDSIKFIENINEEF